MKTINKNVTEVIDSDYHGYAMYVLENRAIPSVIDGMKSVHRKLVYGMITDYKGKKTKMSDISGISKHNYHHGETSAAGAAITLTAEYNNNVPLFQGYGNFGSRLIQEAAAPRYIFASLNSKFYDYFMDFEVTDKNIDPDNPEPQTYLPIIPWVLVNGIEGIAVGFACKFLPHDPKDITKACIAYLKGKKQPRLIPSFPQFSGTVTEDEEVYGKYIIQGKVERTKRNTWFISEVPYGLDRESYFNTLNKMEEAGTIVEFEDNCDKSGFGFTVKLNNEQDSICAEDPISYFKLSKSVTENYTTLDEKGKLKLFDTKEQIVSYFCDYRLKKVDEKLKYQINKLEIEIKWLTTKAHFVGKVASNKIVLKDKKKADWIVFLSKLYSHSDEDSNRLLAIPVVDMTEDYIQSLNEKIEQKKEELETIKSKDAKTVFLEKLEALL